MEEDIKNSFNRIETIMNNEVCEFNKTIIEGNLNVIKRYIENLINRNKQLEERSNRINEQNIKYQNTLEKLQKETIWKSKVREKIEEYNSKMAEQVYIIKEFGEHKGNREKLTMYKDYRDAYGELLEERN